MQCKHCLRRYTPAPKRQGYPQSLREQAVKLYIDGMNYRRIGRQLGINHKTVMLWVKAHVAALPPAPLPEDNTILEADELYTFVEAKKTSSTS